MHFFEVNHARPNDQAQRPGAREAAIATATPPPGSLQRMVRRLGHNTNQPPSGSGPDDCQSITARCVRDNRNSQPKLRVSLAPVMSASVKVQSRNVVRRKSAPRSTAPRKLTRSKMEARKSARDKSAALKSTSMKSFQFA